MDGGARGLRLFLPFYFFTFLLLKATAGNSELVAMAVRKEIAICKIVFQVFTFIFLNVKC